MKDEVLLKIYRQYSKDESIKYLFNKISRLQYRIGELHSKVAELSYKTVSERKHNKIVKEWQNKYFNLKALQNK